MKQALINILIILLFCALNAENGIHSSIEDATSPAPAKEQLLLSKLEQLEKDGIQDADLYYDMGVCHQGLGNIGFATLYYLRALDLDSAHHNAQHNLKVLKELNPEAFEPEGLYLIELLKKIIAWMNYPRLAVLILIFGLFSVLCLHWLIHLKPEAEKGPPVLFLSLSSICLLVLILAVPFKWHAAKNDDRAVVITAQAMTYDDEKATEPGTAIAIASIVKILQQQGAMYQVRTPASTTKWMHGNELKKVKEP